MAPETTGAADNRTLLLHYTTYQKLNSATAYKLLEHRLFPTNHHRQFPILHCSISPHVLLKDDYLLLVWAHHQYRHLFWIMSNQGEVGLLFYIPVCLWHRTPASVAWVQYWTTPDWQSISLVSLPLHETLFSAIGPLPCPKALLMMGSAPNTKYHYGKTIHNYTDFLSYQGLWSLVVYKQLLHQISPNCCGRLCPSYCSCRFLHDLQTMYLLLLV